MDEKKILKTIKKEIPREYKKKSSELLSGVFSSIFSLKGLDFDSITENDLNNAKFIHWPSTVKRNKPIYKLFKEERTANIVLAIDELLLTNKYYLELFLEIKKELSNIEVAFLSKYVYFLRLEKKVNINNFHLNNIGKIEEMCEEMRDKKINLLKLFKIKNSLILLFSDFLDIDIKELKNFYQKSKNSDLVNLVFLPPFDYYYLVDPFKVEKIREKILEKTKNLNLKKYYL